MTQAKPPYWAPYKSYILLYYGKTHPLTSLKSVSFFFPPLLGNKEWSLLNLFPWSQLQSDPLLPWSLVPLLLPFSLHTGVHFLSAIMQWTAPTPPLSWWWGTYNPGYEASLCQLALWTAPTVVNTIYFARAKYAANTLLRWHISPRATTSAPGHICRGTSGPFHQCQVNRLLFSMAELESWLPHIWPHHLLSLTFFQCCTELRNQATETCSWLWGGRQDLSCEKLGVKSRSSVPGGWKSLGTWTESSPEGCNLVVLEIFFKCKISSHMGFVCP